MNIDKEKRGIEKNKEKRFQFSFPSPRLVAQSMQKKPCLPYHLYIAAETIEIFTPFTNSLVRDLNQGCQFYYSWSPVGGVEYNKCISAKE